MLDVFGILVSGIAILYVVFRALQFDGSRPWFETSAPETNRDAAEAPAPPGRRAARRSASRRPDGSRNTSR